LPSTRFLFWNINRKPLADVVSELADSHKIDVLMLAECEADPTTILRVLNHRANASFHFSTGASPTIRIFTRFSGEFLNPTFESDRISIRRLNLPARSEVLLAVIHFPSKRYWSNDSQSMECTELARRIVEEETRAGHQRTVLVGDFNMNPFESGMVGAAGLNSVMSRRVAARNVRTVQGREYPFFYNPMWGHFGDAKSDTAGSYFYDRAEHVNYFWNMFDQVLVRPGLAAKFDSAQLKLVTAAGPRSLVRPDGRPNRVSYSDHLPILFELEF
jgi:endonuclease/exonuclease/phosphatase family metal-dependent hydrolase